MYPLVDCAHRRDSACRLAPAQRACVVNKQNGMIPKPDGNCRENQTSVGLVLMPNMPWPTSCVCGTNVSCMIARTCSEVQHRSIRNTIEDSPWRTLPHMSTKHHFMHKASLHRRRCNLLCMMHLHTLIEFTWYRISGKDRAAKTNCQSSCHAKLCLTDPAGVSIRI